MDELLKLSASGGSDRYPAGTYSITGAQVLTITLTGSAGNVDITVNNITATAEYDTSPTITAAAFVTDHAAKWVNKGITVTSSGADLIFTLAAGSVVGITANISGATSSLTGTGILTGNRLPYPVCAFDVNTDAVVSSCKYKDNNGVARPLFKRFYGQTLAAGTDYILFEEPVVEIVIASGVLILHHIK